MNKDQVWILSLLRGLVRTYLSMAFALSVPRRISLANVIYFPAASGAGASVWEGSQTRRRCAGNAAFLHGIGRQSLGDGGRGKS